MKENRKQKTLKNDLILIGCLVIAAALAAFAVGLFAGTGHSAVLEYGDESAEIDLSKDGRYEFDNNGINIHIQVANGKAGFVDSECPDHLCEHYGMLGETGDTAICLPARAILKIDH